jgi:hypothetical protein
VPRLILIVCALSLLMTACGTKQDRAGIAVESYLNAMVSKDSSKLSALSCSDWEQSAQTELDSFQAVEVKLQNAICATTGKEGDKTLVTCQGKLVATYGSENQELDLSKHTYLVIEQGGEWLVCGER